MRARGHGNKEMLASLTIDFDQIRVCDQRQVRPKLLLRRAIQVDEQMAFDQHPQPKVRPNLRNVFPSPARKEFYKPVVVSAHAVSHKVSGRDIFA